MNNKEVIAIVTAADQGGKIEYRKKDSVSNSWLTWSGYDWNFSLNDYRIAEAKDEYRKMSNKEMLEVISAFEKGEKIEYLDAEGKWVPTYSPCWNFAKYRYRVVIPKNKTTVTSLAMCCPGEPTRATHRVEIEVTWDGKTQDPISAKLLDQRKLT